MNLFDIAFKDMRLAFRSRTALIFMFVIPVLVTILFSFMFSGIAGGDEAMEVPRTAVVVANLDAGDVPALLTMPEAEGMSGVDLAGADSMGDILVQMLQGDTIAGIVEVTTVPDAGTARAAVDTQEAGAAVIIPPNFSDALSGGAPAEVELYYDPTLSIGPAIVESLVNRFVDSFAAGTIGVTVAMSQLAEAGAAVGPETAGGYITRYTAALSEQNQAGGLLVVQAPAGETAEENPLAAMLSLILGGMMVFFAFFTGANTLQSIITEEENGTLARLFSTPVSHLVIFGGKFLAALVTLVVQVAVLLLFGRLAFDIRWGQPLPVFLAAVGLVLLAATTGLFLVSLLKNSRQGGTIFGGLLTIMGMIGMMTIFTASAPYTPPALNTISLLVPQGWAIRGLRQAIEGSELSSLALTFLIVLLWSALFFAIGQRRLQRRFA
jgi:ABC-2 type transport system permease protein